MLPLADKFQGFVLNLTVSNATNTPILPFDASRTKLVIANNTNSKVLQLEFRGIGKEALTQFVQINGQEIWSYEIHGLMVCAEIVGIANAFDHPTSVYYQRFTGC